MAEERTTPSKVTTSSKATTPGKAPTITTPTAKAAAPSPKSSSNKRVLYPNSNEIDQREVTITADEFEYLRSFPEMADRQFSGTTKRVRLWPHEIVKLNERRKSRGEKLVKEASGTQANPLFAANAMAKGLKYMAEKEKKAKKAKKPKKKGDNADDDDEEDNEGEEDGDGEEDDEGEN